MAAHALARQPRFALARNIISILVIVLWLGLIAEIVRPPRRTRAQRDPEWENAIRAMGARMSRFYSERQ